MKWSDIRFFSDCEPVAFDWLLEKGFRLTVLHDGHVGGALSAKLKKVLGLDKPVIRMDVYTGHWDCIEYIPRTGCNPALSGDVYDPAMGVWNGNTDDLFGELGGELGLIRHWKTPAQYNTDRSPGVWSWCREVRRIGAGVHAMGRFETKEYNAARALLPAGYGRSCGPLSPTEGR